MPLWVGEDARREMAQKGRFYDAHEFCNCLNRSVIQKLIDEGQCNRSFTHIRGYALTIVAANIADRKDAMASLFRKFVFVLSGITIEDLEKLKTRCTIKLIKFDQETGETQIEKNAIYARVKIKIVTGKIKHIDMLSLFKAANPKVVVTGDQSLSEAISANLNFAYAAPYHKRKLEGNLFRNGYTTFNYEGYHTIRIPRFLKDHETSEINQKNM